MNNIFLPSDTIACIKDKWIGKPLLPKVDGVETKLVTEEDIEREFKNYVSALRDMFGSKSLVIPKTRCLGDGVFVPYLSYEFVYKDNAIKDYTKDGYYAVTVNGYRISDIVDAAYCNFKSDRAYAKSIMCQVADWVGSSEHETVPAARIQKATMRLADFFYTNLFKSFDSYLTAVIGNESKDWRARMESAYSLFGITVAFSEDIPTPTNPEEIYSICHRAQEEGMAADESDIDGWKANRRDPDASDITKFIDYIQDILDLNVNDENEDEEKEVDQEAQTSSCQKDERNCCCHGDDKQYDPIEKIKKCVDEMRDHVDSKPGDVPINVVGGDKTVETNKNTDNQYYYFVKYTDKDGKTHYQEYKGDDAKNKIDSIATKRKFDQPSTDPKIDEIVKKIERLEKLMERLGENGMSGKINRDGDSGLRDWPFNTEPYPGWPFTQDYRARWQKCESPFDVSPIVTMLNW